MACGCIKDRALVERKLREKLERKQAWEIGQKDLPAGERRARLIDQWERERLARI